MSNNTPSNIIHIAIDGNEANVKDRVGSNVYAHQIIKQLAYLIKKRSKLKATVLLSSPRKKDMPTAEKNWQYLVVKPQKMWTQFALPTHLWFNSSKYDVFFTPGHYAPRSCPIPYISSVMDLGFLEYPDHFKRSDLIQLKKWTSYSVKNASKVITISKFTKKNIIKHYQKKASDIVVAYPSTSLNKKQTYKSDVKEYFKRKKIGPEYFLFLGTFQPRKNLIRLINAFEIFSRWHAANYINKKRKNNLKTTVHPQLVLAGKIGWLADPILYRIKKSPFENLIITTGYIEEAYKPSLYKNSIATTLVGLHEGFGIPALEALKFKSIPIVSKTSSLPEVVGDAGVLVDPISNISISNAFKKVYSLSAKEKSKFKKEAIKQVKKFSWHESGKRILEEVTGLAGSTYEK